MNQKQNLIEALNEVIESRDTHKQYQQLLSRYKKLIEELGHAKKREKQLQFQLDNINGKIDIKKIIITKNPEIAQLLSALETKKQDIAKNMAERERTTRITGLDPALRK